jgi:hypothetical protein
LNWLNFLSRSDNTIPHAINGRLSGELQICKESGERMDGVEWARDWADEMTNDECLMTKEFPNDQTGRKIHLLARVQKFRSRRRESALFKSR